MADEKGKKEEAVYTKPTSQLDLERRLENDNYPADVLVRNDEDDARNPEVVVAPYKVEGNDTSAYRGVSPEYMTYADDTHKPLDAEEGPELEAQKRMESGIANVRRTVDPRGEVSTGVGVSDFETVGTATSGEGFSPKLVDAEPDFKGRASDDVPYAGQPKQDSSASAKTVTPAKTTVPAKTATSNK